MEALAANTIEGFNPSMVVEASDLDRVDWKAAREVVFLWPDAIGVGWRGIEGDVLRRLPASTPVMVLNGRRRYFNLREHGRAGFLWRRALDKTFAFEFVFLAGFLLSSPVLALVDRVRGDDESPQRQKRHQKMVGR
jgi:hypothetical protein